MTFLSPSHARALADLPGDIAASFELFPAKSDTAEATLLEAARELAPLGPRFFSVTYGAGGSTRERSLGTVAAVIRETGVPTAAHLTCVGASRGEVDEIARAFWEVGARHIVALRGDGGKPGDPFVPHPQGYRSAAELVAGLRAIAPFEISVAAYPECHPDAASPAADLDNLKRKLDAGATRALTQFFFSPDLYFRFRDRAAAAGITAEIVPGILPVITFAQTQRFAAACGASIPAWFARMFDGLEEQPGARALVAAAVAAELCGQLYAGGVRQFHFYTLNRADLTTALCRLLGVHPQAAARLERAA